MSDTSPDRACFSPFPLASPFGSCAGVWLPKPEQPCDVSGAPFEALHGEERSWAATTELGRRTTWLGGRLALRSALARLGARVGPILADPRGAPALPDEWVGSVSHKEGLAVGLCEKAHGSRIGVDVEEAVQLRPAFARRLLSAAERAELDGISDDELGLELIWRFSVKEAIYKALDPFVQRYVAFSEVSLWPASAGRVEVSLELARPDGGLEVEAHTGRFGRYHLSFARARRR